MARPISIQLYTLREECQNDFPGVIARLGDIGYRGVEPFSFLGLSPEELRGRVEDAGMEVTAAHVNLPREDDVEAALDAQQALGNDSIIVPMCPPNAFETADSVKETADVLNEHNVKVAARGMTFGYHNHWWEFGQEIDGEPAFNLLFSLLEPGICSELDIYWAQTGGADPAQVVGQLGERCRFLHVKDGPCDDPGADMVAVGDGIVDTRGILEAATSAEWHIVELDRCATDMFEAVEESYRFLTSEGLSLGKDS